MILDMALATRGLEATARMFRALSDETRLLLLEQLRGGEQCVCDLTDELDASQSRLSFHLKTLKDAGIVVDHRRRADRAGSCGPSRGERSDARGVRGW